MHPQRALCLALLGPLFLVPAANAQLQTGAPAPELALETWLNAPAGFAPTTESFRGKAVMIEFWGTWCEPCLRSMPHVQELSEIYAEDGLQVLAIANEPAETIQPYLDKVALTFPIGCDPEQKVHQLFGIGGWPTTVLIDRGGAVRYVGSPWNVEPTLLQALGVRNDLGLLLDGELAAAVAGQVDEERRMLRRLTHALARAFPLSGWAASRSQGATPAEGVEALTPAELLDRCASLPAGEPKQRRALLASLAARGANTFDLLAWTRARAAETFPLELPEVEEMLADARYPGLLEALIYRAPTAEARARAAKDAGFASWCQPVSGATREDAKRGLMLQRYVFAGIEPRDVQRYWTDLGLAGLRPDPGGRLGMGLPFGREHVAPETVASYASDALRQCIAARTYASGRSIAPASLDGAVEKERERITRSLDGRYGVPKSGG